MFDVTQQKQVVALITIGFVITFIGGFVYALTLGVIPLLLSFIGLGTAGWGIALGFKTAGADSANRPIEVADNAQIMNILVVNTRGEHVFDPEMYDPHELTYLVQILMPTGKRIEFETHPNSLETMGEGMRGRITYQGKWLNKFEPQFNEQRQ